MLSTKMPQTSARGFTLIELLVVIAIIGILSGVVLASISTARMKARDIRRVADLAQIRNALEMYFDDRGYYPQARGEARGDSGCSGWDCNGYAISNAASWTALAADLAPYISPLPTDPINSTGCSQPWINNCFLYSYGNVGKSGSTYNPAGKIQYDLSAQFENDNYGLRCEIKKYRFYFDNRLWCPPYPNQMYEASPG